MRRKRTTVTTALWLGLVLAGASLAGQSGPAAEAPPGLPEANQKLQAGDAAGAAKVLEGLTAREPANAEAWRLLGVANLRLKNLDQAEAAFRKALQAAPDLHLAMYGLAGVAARRGNSDAAFEWLSKVKATRKMDMTFMQVDPNLESLKADPRFARLQPAPEEFADPFVEKVKILREWDGEAVNDQFGWIARSIGDVDGDRVNDVVTSAPTKDIGGARAGRVYAYSGKTGKLLWSADGTPGDRLGLGIEGAGDVNRDGVPDVIASAPDAGKAYVYSGRDGRILLTLTAEDKGDSFGRHVSGAGDVNGDGHADVIVGAPGNNAGGKGAGRAYVYSGKDGRLILTLTGEREGDAFGSTVAGFSDGKRMLLLVGAPNAGPRKTGRVYVYDALSAKPKFVVESDEKGSALGQMFVSVPGDLDGDGFPDIYASDWSHNAKGNSTGRVYLHSGSTGRLLRTLTGETAGEGFGIGTAGAGDVNGDGFDDLIIGSWQFAGAAPSGGRAALFSGKDGSVLKTYTCKVPGDTFGFDAVGIGDVDGDGVIDLLVTSAWSGIHGYHSGRVFIISSGVERPARPARPGKP
ncbi:MAG TPA: FG-GAP-like repeat-containing protein [Thermoanaerobaculia bacterium]|nr:FG-GAP-like repeat-containing protein [Thermoanaerobaculia bacterium]